MKRVAGNAPATLDNYGIMAIYRAQGQQSCLRRLFVARKRQERTMPRSLQQPDSLLRQNVNLGKLPQQQVRVRADLQLPSSREILLPTPLTGEVSKREFVPDDLAEGANIDRDIPLPGYDRINFIDWADDAKSLWVSSSRAGKATLLNVDLKGNIRPVLSEGNMTLGWAIPSPDGRRLAIWKDSGKPKRLDDGEVLNAARGE